MNDCHRSNTVVYLVYYIFTLLFLQGTQNSMHSPQVSSLTSEQPCQLVQSGFRNMAPVATMAPTSTSFAAFKKLMGLLLL